MVKAASATSAPPKKKGAAQTWSVPMATSAKVVNASQVVASIMTANVDSYAKLEVARKSNATETQIAQAATSAQTTHARQVVDAMQIAQMATPASLSSVSNHRDAQRIQHAAPERFAKAEHAKKVADVILIAQAATPATTELVANPSAADTRTAKQAKFALTEAAKTAVTGMDIAQQAIIVTLPKDSAKLDAVQIKTVPMD
jgi:hypothetical protein